MWFYADEDASLTVDFMMDGVFVIPTSASYLLRDHMGAQVGVTTNLTPTTTSAMITIPAAQNGLTSGSLLEHRYVVVKFVSNGRSYTQLFPYKLTAFVPFTTTPADVRRLTGLSENELPDNEIDVPSAYFNLFNQYSTSFSSQLVATDFRARLANEAIALQAAIDLVGSFPLRVPVTATSEDAAFSRTNNLDFPALEADLRRRLQETMNLVTSAGETTIDIFAVSSPTDPFTGA